MSPTEIIYSMVEKDKMSQWLGLEFLEIERGYCKLKMVITKEMVNGFNIAHGGICYSLADSALAFAANSFGQHAVSIGNSIKYLAPCHSGMEIIAETELISKSRTLMHYIVRIRTENNVNIALFEGSCYVKSMAWDHQSP